MADLVDETLRAVRARLRELAPMVAEYERLESAYAALDGAGAEAIRRAGETGAGAPGGRGGRGRRAAGRAASGSRRAGRGENKAAVYGVIGQRPGVTVAEIAAVTGIAKPLIYNTTRAGVQRGELEKVVLPGGGSGFRTVRGATSGGPDTSVG